MIYFVQMGNEDGPDKDGPIKIGSTKDMPKRLVSLQISNPYKLTLLALSTGDKGLESLLHKIFKEFKIRGDWFRANEKIIDYIKFNCYEPRIYFADLKDRKRVEWAEGLDDDDGYQVGSGKGLDQGDFYRVETAAMRRNISVWEMFRRILDRFMENEPFGESVALDAAKDKIHSLSAALKKALIVGFIERAEPPYVVPRDIQSDPWEEVVIDDKKHATNLINISVDKLSYYDPKYFC